MNSLSTTQRYAIASDGFIHLSWQEMQLVLLNHFTTGLDDIDEGHCGSGATLTTISGYTEWISDSIPMITIGWDWKICVQDQQVCIVRVGEPRNNLMLRDANQCDVGPMMTNSLLSEWVDCFDWQSRIRVELNFYP